MATVEDLERIAALTGLRIARSDLERLLPILNALYADLERLSALPVAGLEPAFTPRRWEESTPQSRPGRRGEPDPPGRGRSR